MKRLKILVTGGAGFIGTNFVYRMLEKYPSYDVVCLDLLTYAGNLKNLEQAQENPRFRFIRGDIADRDFIEPLFEVEHFDAVVNFAAESHVDRSIVNPSVFLMTNIIGTQVLMDASRKAGVKRFHQVSTDEVYGDLPLDRPDLLFTEQTPIHTSSPYSASKASADLIAFAYFRTYGFPVTISRCSNNYGPYQFPEKLIPLMISRARAGKTVPVYGDGSNVRDWLFVGDHCAAVDLILHRGVPGEVYNIGGNTEKTNLEVVKTILQQLGKPESLIEFVRDRAGHDLRYAIDASKIKAALGWEPATAFTEGMAKTVDWYLQNSAWLEEILTGGYREYYSAMYGVD